MIIHRNIAQCIYKHPVGSGMWLYFVIVLGFGPLVLSFYCINLVSCLFLFYQYSVLRMVWYGSCMVPVWFLVFSLSSLCLFLPLVFHLCGYNLLFPDLFWQLFDFCVLLLVFSVYLNSNEPKWVHLSIFSHQFWWSRNKHN